MPRKGVTQEKLSLNLHLTRRIYIKKVTYFFMETACCEFRSVIFFYLHVNNIQNYGI